MRPWKRQATGDSIPISRGWLFYTLMWLLGAAVAVVSCAIIDVLVALVSLLFGTPFFESVLGHGLVVALVFFALEMALVTKFLREYYKEGKRLR